MSNERKESGFAGYGAVGGMAQHGAKMGAQGPGRPPMEASLPVSPEYKKDIRQWADKWELKCADDGTKYWKLDVVYCEKPVDPMVQHLAIYAPESYMIKGIDGKVSVNSEGRVSSTGGVTYSPANAPIIYSNRSGGYSGSKVTGVNTGFIRQGYVQVAGGGRGKETTDEQGRFTGQMPAVVVDLKAGIRYLKANNDYIPGDTNSICSFGASSGGAMSTMLGASGNAPVFDKYLKEIGAAETSDDIFVALCYCPITNLNKGDAAYEWFQAADEYFLFNSMAFDYKGNDISAWFPVGPTVKYALGGNYIGGGHEDELSAYLYDWYVKYIKSLGFDLGDDGRSGAYFTDLVDVISASLTDYLERVRAGKITPTVSLGRGLGSPKIEFESLDAYLDYLKNEKNGAAWFSYDKETGKALITDYDEYMNSWMGRNKMCPSLDSYNHKSNEVAAFRTQDGTLKHFSPVVRDALNAVYEKYLNSPESFDGFTYELIKDENGLVTGIEYTPGAFSQQNADYLRELAKTYTDEVSAESERILDMMSPVEYILNRDNSESEYCQSTLAGYWRFNIGTCDADQGLPQAWITHNALLKYAPDKISESVVTLPWGKGHGANEVDNQDLYDYIDGVMKSAGRV